MKVVVFRNRLREGVEAEYGARATQIYELALGMPGLVSSKDFVAEDGQRLTLVEFRSTEELGAWRAHPEHEAAQREGRERFYEEYSIQVCDLVRESRFSRKPSSAGRASRSAFSASLGRLERKLAGARLDVSQASALVSFLQRVTSRDFGVRRERKRRGHHASRRKRRDEDHLLASAVLEGPKPARARRDGSRVEACQLQLLDDPGGIFHVDDGQAKLLVHLLG